MTATTGEIVERLTLNGRPNASRKLLARKAAERPTAGGAENEALEAVFPKSVEQLANAAAAVAQLASPAAQPYSQPAPLPSAWSDEDERAFQGMSARRKAAGYQRRGRDVGTQVLAVGKITPNTDTVSAVIVGLIAQRGSLTRQALLDAMSGAPYSHPKARPQDRNWCQGYVAGALRDGFLMLAEAAADTPIEEQSQ